MSINKDELMKEIGDKIDSSVNTALTSKFGELEAKFQPLQPIADPEQVDREIKKNEFKSYGEFLSAIWKLRNLGQTDSRLVFLSPTGDLMSPYAVAKEQKPTDPNQVKAALAAGADSTGGYLN